MTDKHEKQLYLLCVTDGHKKKCVGVFLVKMFVTDRASERRNENIIVSGTLKTGKLLKSKKGKEQKFTLV